MRNMSINTLLKLSSLIATVFLASLIGQTQATNSGSQSPFVAREAQSLFISHVKPKMQLATTTATRDPHAVTLLTQALNVAGSTATVSAIQDFTATGNVTYYWNESALGTVTVKGRGLRQSRIDASGKSGVQSWVINNDKAFQKSPDGSILPLPTQNTVRPVSATFPLLELFSVIQDTTVSVSDGGLVTQNGHQVHDIQIQKTFPANSDPVGYLSKISKAHIFVDANDLTILSIKDTVYPRNGGPGEYTHEMQFSSYQTVNGVLVPFTVTELVAGQRTAIFQFNQISFNTGLTDSDFQ